MRHIKILLAVSCLVAVIQSCSDKETQYIDVNTGKSINVVKDSTTGYMLNAETKEPLVIYYDTKTKDTLYGRTGEVINNKVSRTPDGKYYYEVPAPAAEKQKVLTQDEIDRQLLEKGDYKKKVGKDGDIKIKHGDTKIKIEGETGEKKIKKD